MVRIGIRPSASTGVAPPRCAAATGRRLAGGIAVAVAVLGSTGCANLGYYWQSATGHLRILHAARPVQDWLADEAAPERLKRQLALSQRLRAFASSELKLPANASYTRYADLGRSAVIWNVVAAPEFSLELHTWCFPVAGCVGYRGYFDEAEARAEAARMRALGLESDAYPVPAYSTLGYLNWLGGDPLLNTFIEYPEGELARLLFHELAHQVVYARDDTTFNESFATAVERLGVQRWLQLEGSPQARADFDRFRGRRQQWRDLTQSTRKALEAIYDEKLRLSPAERLQRKNEAMARFRAEYGRLRDSWNVDPARLRLTDQWVAQANNASFGAVAAYDGLVPGFEGLFASVGGDWARFYDEARRLAALGKDERHRLLKAKEIPGA